MIEAYRENGLFVPEPEIDKTFNKYDATAVWEAQVVQLLKEDSTFLPH